MNNSIELKEKHVKLPKLGLVALAKSQEPKGRILNATIRQHASGTFFASLLCEEEIHELPKTGFAVGVDLGITDFSMVAKSTIIDSLPEWKRNSNASNGSCPDVPSSLRKRVSISLKRKIIRNKNVKWLSCTKKS